MVPPPTRARPLPPQRRRYSPPSSSGLKTQIRARPIRTPPKPRRRSRKGRPPTAARRKRLRRLQCRQPRCPLPQRSKIWASLVSHVTRTFMPNRANRLCNPLDNGLKCPPPPGRGRTSSRDRRIDARMPQRLLGNWRNRCSATRRRPRLHPLSRHPWRRIAWTSQCKPPLRWGKISCRTGPQRPRRRWLGQRFLRWRPPSDRRRKARLD